MYDSFDNIYQVQALLMLGHDVVLIVLQYTTVTMNTGTTTTIGVKHPQIEDTVGEVNQSQRPKSRTKVLDQSLV